MTVIGLILIGLTLVLGIPVVWFCIQIALALLPSRTAKFSFTRSKVRTTVLIPAHNESIHLLPTLHALLKEKNEFTRILVVADNCNDDTAEISRISDSEI